MSRVLIVTGGSRGIGAATCLLAAQEGWSVVVNYHANAAAAQGVVAEIVAQRGKAAAFKADVAQEADVVALFDFAAGLGDIAGLVNNAGILQTATGFAQVSLERWQKLLATNLTGSFLCAREAVRRMALSRGGKGGAVVNLSSMAAVLGAAHEFVDYAATKGAIDSLTIGLAREVAADGIRVNAVRPGLIDTEMHASTGDAVRAQRLVGGVPMRRVGSAAEVAQAIVWLLSDGASYTTGTIVNVSGGR